MAGTTKITFSFTKSDGSRDIQTIEVPNGKDGAKGDKGDKGDDGGKGVGIKTITVTVVS